MDILWDIGLPLLQLALSLIALWKICDTMVEGISSISYRLKIPQSVAGATLAAISSSAPEFGTSMFAILITEQGQYADIGLATIIGSAIFNVLVIIGVSALFKNLKVLPRVYSRDGLFYLITVFLLLFVLRDGKIDFKEAVGGLALYGLYSIILIRDIKTHQEKQEAPKLLPSWLSLLYFLGGLAIIGIACHFLVDAIIKLAKITEIPEVFLSVLVVAAGTSIPDCFASIAAARRGNGAMAISNALGSNVFDILVCLGVPICILNSKGANYTMGIKAGIADPFGKSLLVFSLVYLFTTLIITLFILRHKWEVGKKKGFFLIMVYLLYCGLIIGAYYIGKDTAWLKNIPASLGFG